ncbi:5-bromo-4-chloroindolyl phosphate hydrolysis family protein [Litchfieldia alkalitelluris]|uniref:5-bromo-4-chloroindolyl phosphate hydrolysis family protein n=1 Tax=Litchfieldia alkalitelluris TaxID=304268 RepID=UPI0009967D55|nr:5-bromo-4-chloroindolyl phosphate hydrolysis family protein [Litchfieldia alkalitelluris]
MNRILFIILRGFLTVNVGAITWGISMFAFDQTFWLSVAYSFLGSGATYGISSAIMKQRFLSKHKLTRKEYRYIKENLAEAKAKIFRLNKALISIRHIPSWKLRLDLVRLTRKIYSITKDEPKRFYRAEKFYFSHLDSAVELAEKYVFLSSQPKRNVELESTLYDTRKTLEKITEKVENDLYHLLSNDIDQLHVELDVAKHRVESEKNDEGRNFK